MKTDNELIAEFMGVDLETEYLVTHYAYDKHFHGWISQSSYDDVKHLNTTGLEETRIKQNPYDTSWDWLMPVVEKINSEKIGASINIDSDRVFLHFPMGYKEDLRQYRDEESGSHISSVYKAVVEFIKWYSQQSKGKE